MIKSLNLAFMGTPLFACPTLIGLLQSRHNIRVIYTQRPKPVGRGYEVMKTPIHQLAEQHTIEVRTPQTLKNEEEQAYLKSLNLDAIIVVAYGMLLPPEVLSIPNFGCINGHASLLPRWRGASPIHSSLKEGDAETGITIMKMDEGLDTGPMYCKESTPITPFTTFQELHDTLSHISARLMLDVVNAVETFHPIPQPLEGVTYAPKITKESGRLHFANKAQDLERQIRAFSAWPGCYFPYQGESIKVFEAEVIPFQGKEKPGTVLDNALTIVCGENALRLKTLQKPGKKIVKTQDFLNGYNLPSGTCLA
jgi:methionyl-tRNA formyltransferase